MTTLYIIALSAVVLITIRLILPVIARGIANRSLAKIDGMRGHIKGIGLNLLGGVITVRNLTLAKQDQASGIETIFVSVREVVVRIPLGKLIRKDFTGSVTLTQPELLYAAVLETVKVRKNKKDQPQAPPQTSPLKTVLSKLPSFMLNVAIRQGKVRYINHSSEPKIDTTITDINITLQDFSNREANRFKNSAVKASAVVYEGSFSVEMELKPMEEQLTFDMNMELKDANMVLLNNFFRTYANFDVNQGAFGMYTEIVARDGGFKGYMKPILKDIDIVGAEDSDDTIVKKIWEGMVASVVQLLVNNKTDQVATRIPFEGRLDDPHVNVFAAIGGILKNAFVRAIKPSFENTFNLGSVVSTVKRFFN